jgi:Piwi domain
MTLLRPPHSSGTAGRKIALISNVYPIKPAGTSNHTLHAYSITDSELVKDRKKCIDVLSDLLADCQWVLSADFVVYVALQVRVISSEYLRFLGTLKSSDIAQTLAAAAFGSFRAPKDAWVARDTLRSRVRITLKDADGLLKGTKSHLVTSPGISSDVGILADIAHDYLTLLPCAVSQLKADACVLDLLSMFVTEGIGLGSARHAEIVNRVISELPKRCLVIKTTHLSQKDYFYRIVKIEVGQSSDQFKFDSYGQSMTLSEYYQTTRLPFKPWSVDLAHASLPLLLVDSKGRRFPPELCFLTSQLVLPRSLGVVPVGMAQLSTKTSMSLSFACRRALDSLAIHTSFSNFGALLDSKPVSVKGRVLPDVCLEYRGRTQMTAVGGSWMLTGQKLVETPQMVVSVAAVSFATNDALEADIVKVLAEESRKHGINIANEVSHTQRLSPTLFDTESLRKALSEASKLASGGVVLVFLPSKSLSIYYQVKKVAETLLGLSTQCICLDNEHLKSLKEEGKRSAVFWQSLALEINAKIASFSGRAGSPNLQQKLLGTFYFQKRTMVIGGYVNAARFHGETEICGLVGTLDRGHSVYATQAIAQNPSRSGEITHMSDMVERLFGKYLEVNRDIPENILYLRAAPPIANTIDVITAELAHLEVAFERLSEHRNLPSKFNKPRVTVVLVRRDHSVRLWCEKPSEQDKKTGNVPTSTIVDSDVTKSGCLNFYLFSNSCPSGTARATHYSVAHDEFYGEETVRRVDELQTVIHGLCHCSLRATRASAVPGQVEAARLLTERVRLYLTGEEAAAAEYVNDRYLLRDGLQSRLQGISFFI